MQYLYHKEAGLPALKLEGDAYKYLFKVRRHKREMPVLMRNLQSNTLYTYRIDTLDKKSAFLTLLLAEEYPVIPKRYLHIGWCTIEPKSVEKVLPTLNEIGVEKITFISCRRSQRQFKIDFKRLEKILINSSQQCGRSRLMQLETSESLEDFVATYPESVLIDFSDEALRCDRDDIDIAVVGCEGGFTEEERAMFERIVGFDTPLILKSESATCAIASKLLL